MRQTRATSLPGLFVLTMALGSPAQAQDTRDVDWPLHNLDLSGGRYSPMDQINRDNVATITPRWLFQHGVIDGVSNQTTPVIVDGTMYVTDSRGSVYAVNAADGHLLWTYDVTELLGGVTPRGLHLQAPGRHLRGDRLPSLERRAAGSRRAQGLQRRAHLRAQPPPRVKAASSRDRRSSMPCLTEGSVDRTRSVSSGSLRQSQPP